MVRSYWRVRIAKSSHFVLKSNGTGVGVIKEVPEPGAPSVWLKEFEEQKKTGLLFTDFKMEDLRLVRYSPSAAALVMRETVDGVQNGKPFEWHINGSASYVNRNRKWVPVLYQDTMAK